MRLLRRRHEDATSGRGATEPSADCPAVVEWSDRSLVTIHGELRRVEQCPVDGVPALEADLHDGSAEVTLIWLGRRSITGVARGRTLTAFGRMGRRHGVRVVYNPRYELDA